MRTPERILNTLVYNLASHYQLFGQLIARVIEDNIQLPDSPLEQRYKHFIEILLRELGSKAHAPPGTIVLVLDALDECESSEHRCLLLTYLQWMSKAAPWLKIIVTGHPEQDIQAAFKGTNDTCVISCDLAQYNATHDIFEHTCTHMAEIAKRMEQLPWCKPLIQQLSACAEGLFIWVETACKFIKGGFNMKARFQQVLAGNHWAEGLELLDQLYMTAIIQGMADQKPDNMRIFWECIGAIIATSARMPLSVASLESLLSSRLSTGVVHIVVNGLRSVLYKDQDQGGIVRVYHPLFADFILDSACLRSFYMDPKERESALAECCLGMMMKELKFNICELETSHVLNRDVVNLEARVRSKIALQLAYGCMHWASHLKETPKGTLQGQLDNFLHKPQLFFWIEALSLLRELGAAVSSLLVLIDRAPVSGKWCLRGLLDL